MNRILVFSWFYPPVNSSEGLVTYKLIKASGYSYDVFTQKNNDLWSYGKEDYLPAPDNVNSIYAKAETIDEWWKEGVEYFKKNADKYDVIMTRSMPPESHKIGLEIKKIKPEIKWLASFGDPIANNPYTLMFVSFESPHSRKNCRNILGVFSPKRIIRNILFHLKTLASTKKTLKKEEDLQNSIFAVCDRIIFNSDNQKEYMFNSFNGDCNGKAFVLNHSFDPLLFPEKKKPNKVKTMSYVGHLDNIRTPKLLLEALSELAEEDKELASKFHLDFYGDLSDYDKLFIMNNELCDIVSVRKPVSYLDSLKIMKNSDWLLHVDGNITQITPKNIFFAAKLADYIGAKNPIFGITMQDGVSADIMNRLGSVCVSYSKNEIKNYLWLIIYKGYTVTTNEEYRFEFSNKAVADKFDGVVRSLTGKED